MIPTTNAKTFYLFHQVPQKFNERDEWKIRNQQLNKEENAECDTTTFYPPIPPIFTEVQHKGKKRTSCFRSTEKQEYTDNKTLTETTNSKQDKL